MGELDLVDLAARVVASPADDEWLSRGDSWEEFVVIAGAMINGLSRVSEPRRACVASNAVEKLEAAMTRADAGSKAWVGYNLATALDAWSSLSRSEINRGWSEDVAEERWTARKLLSVAAQAVNLDDAIRCKAWANLGANLYLGARVGEAVDACVESLRLAQDSGSKIASAPAFLAKYLWREYQHQPGSYGYAMARHHARLTVVRRDHFLSSVGDKALLSEMLSIARNPDVPYETLDDYSLWLATERLGFGFDEIGFADTDSSHNRLWIAGAPHVTGGEETDLLAAIFNDLKSDFLVARSLAWDARNDPREDASHYLKTTEEERFGREIGLLRLALVGAMSVVDRCSLIWAIRAGINDDRLDARTVWTAESHNKRNSGRLRPEFVTLIKESRDWIQFTAAAEIRHDLDGVRGFLGHLTNARNSAVHRTLTASLGTSDDELESEKGRDVIGVQTLRNYTLEGLRLARHSIRYAAIASMKR